jgi:hypothetical protein
MTFVEQIVLALQKIPNISAVVIVNKEGDVVGQFGVKDPSETGQLAIFLGNMGKQVGDSLSVSPVVSCNVDLGDRRFITFIYRGVHFGVMTATNVAAKTTIAQVKKVIDASLAKKGQS